MIGGSVVACSRARVSVSQEADEPRYRLHFEQFSCIFGVWYHSLSTRCIVLRRIKLLRDKSPICQEIVRSESVLEILNLYFLSADNVGIIREKSQWVEFYGIHLSGLKEAE